MQDLNITPRMATVRRSSSRPGPVALRVRVDEAHRHGQWQPVPDAARLEAAGWLTRGKESIDPGAAGLARTNYAITGAADSAARVQLAELSERFRPPVPGRLRSQGSTA